MHKIKKSIQALRNYLGRDTQGLGLLDAVSDIANDLRKEVAKEKEQATNTLTSNRTSGEVARRLEKENNELTLQLSQAKVVQAQQDRDIQALGRALTEAEADVAKLNPDLPELPVFEVDLDDGLLLDPRAITATFYALRKAMKVCPQAVGRFKNPEPSDGRISRIPPQVYELNTLISSYSPMDMMTLGRFVALRASIAVPCIVQSVSMVRSADETVAAGGKCKVHGPAHALREAWLGKAIADHFVRWFRYNVPPPGLVAREVTAYHTSEFDDAQD